MISNQPLDDFDQCWCGKGRTYKDCHKRVDAAPEKDKFNAAQGVYADGWKATSQHYQSEGIYNWGAQQLRAAQPRRILDVGCGTGSGVRALYDTFGAALKVVTLEENPYCFAEASTVLTAAGIPCATLRRLETRLTSQGYVQLASDVQIPDLDGCTIVEADAACDPLLCDRLAALGTFDVVTCWLTGTHLYRTKQTSTKHISMASEYREYLQRNIYRLAGRLLKVGGTIQILDRGEAPDTAGLMRGIKAYHQELAAGSPLIIQEIKFRLYKEPTTMTTPMAPDISSLVRGFDPKRLCVSSIISIKRGPS